MNDMVRADPIDYDNISNQVRSFCAERLYELEKSIRPMVDGTFGEVAPGHLVGYVGIIRALGKLYQVDKPPRDVANLVPLAKVQELLARMEVRHQEALDLAVREAEARVREELSSGSQRSITAARDLVASRLMELEERRR